MGPSDQALWARVTGRANILKPDETSETITGTEPAVRVVRNWLLTFEADTKSQEG
jgi:hypothetical protein